MNRPARPALLLLAALALASSGPLSAADHPYLVVTTTGETVKALQKPSVQGKLATILLFPDGNRTTLAASKIDWPATERANAGPPPTPTISSWDLENMAGDASLKGVAGRTKVDDAKATGKATDYGKIKTQTGESYAVASDGAGLAANSVMKHVEMTDVTIGRYCTATVTLRNVSSFRLKKLEAVFVVPVRLSSKPDDEVDETVAEGLPDLGPGQSIKVRLSVNCYGALSSRITLRDVTGSTEQAFPAGEVQPYPQSVPLPTQKPAATPKPQAPRGG